MSYLQPYMIAYVFQRLDFKWQKLLHVEERFIPMHGLFRIGIFHCHHHVIHVLLTSGSQRNQSYIGLSRLIYYLYRAYIGLL